MRRIPTSAAMSAVNWSVMAEMMRATNTATNNSPAALMRCAALESDDNALTSPRRVCADLRRRDDLLTRCHPITAVA